MCVNHSPLTQRLSRRWLLEHASMGFGALALNVLLRSQSWSSDAKSSVSGMPHQGLHHAAKATNVIFLYMDGGVSQMDSFDPKPRLQEEHGKPFAMKAEPTQFENNGATMGCPWKFERMGNCGLTVSELFPHVGKLADDLCVVRSMTSKFSEHNAANYFLHSGLGMAGRPSMGAWTTYGLGSANENLPGYVVLDGGLIPSGGVECFGSGFLPANYQASLFQNRSPALANTEPLEKSPKLQQNKLASLQKLDRLGLDAYGSHDSLEAAVRNYELAYKMQISAPAVSSLADETPETLRAYGMESSNEATRSYARQCIIARRLVEHGVRFVELTCPKISGVDRWDAHSDLKNNHSKNAMAVDQPIAALLQDLKQRSLLEQTLVVWSGEFGRTPFAQGSDGRDHNPFGFTCWLAGGGSKPGFTYGATDEYGYKVVENPLEIHDLHATMLHLLGVDHEQLTYRFGGRDYSLTDVHGKVVRELIA